MLAQWMDDWKPTTGARQQLVERTVSAAWRLNRCTRVETAALSVRAHKALKGWDNERETALDSDVAKLSTEPFPAMQRLRQTREGIDRLIDLWTGISNALGTPGQWFDIEEHHDRYLNLRGFLADDPSAFDINVPSWKLLLVNRTDLPRDEHQCPHTPAAAEQVRKMMYLYAESMIAKLTDRQSKPRDDEPARLAEAEVAAFAFVSQDLTLHRYEDRLDRQSRTNLNQLVMLTKTGIDLVAEDAPIVEEIAPIEAKAEPVTAKKVKDKASSKDIAPNEPNEIEADSTVVQVERDRGGRIWPVEGEPEGSIDVDRV
jgi:hypothetical protein